MPFMEAPHFDAANIASHLPRPLQKPGGMALEMLKQAFGGDDPAAQVMGVSVGPNAIPLMNEEGYLRQTLGTGLEDLAAFSKRKNFHSLRPNSPTFPQHATDTLRGAYQNPALAPKIMGAEMTKGAGMRYAQGASLPSGIEPPTSRVEQLVQALADAYHKGLPHQFP